MEPDSKQADQDQLLKRLRDLEKKVADQQKAIKEIQVFIADLIKQAKRRRA